VIRWYDDTPPEEPRLCGLPHHRDPDRPRRLRRGSFVCGGHAHGLTELLALLPELHHALATVGAPSEVKIGGSRPSETPIPIRQDALDLRYGGVDVDPKLNAWDQVGITELLAGWARITAEEQGFHLPTITDPQTAPPALAKFLTVHLDWIVEQPWVLDMLPELEAVRDRANRALGAHHRDDLTRINCPQPDCAGTLIAPYRDRELLHPEAGDVRLATLKCEACGHVEMSSDWHRITDRSVWLTDREAELWTDTQGHLVTAATIRSWANRGHIDRYSKAGRIVYSAEQLAKRLPPVHGPVCQECHHPSCARVRDLTRGDGQAA
jgi:hypothetical protein